MKTENETSAVESAIAQQLITVPADKLRPALEALLLFASKDSARWILNGLYFHAANGRLEIVGCDGRTLAAAVFKVTDKAPVVSGIIKAETIKNLLSPFGTLGKHVLKANPGAVLAIQGGEDMYKRSGKEMILTLGKVTECGRGWQETYGPVFRTSTVSGEFPNWQQVCPKINNVGRLTYGSFAKLGSAVESHEKAIKDAMATAAFEIQTYVGQKDVTDDKKVELAAYGLKCLKASVKSAVDRQSTVVFSRLAGAGSTELGHVLQTVKITVDSLNVNNAKVEIKANGLPETDAGFNPLFLERAAEACEKLEKATGRSFMEPCQERANEPLCIYTDNSVTADGPAAFVVIMPQRFN